jgi:hypothetical protein
MSKRRSLTGKLLCGPSEFFIPSFAKVSHKRQKPLGKRKTNCRKKSVGKGKRRTNRRRTQK